MWESKHPPGPPGMLLHKKTGWKFVSKEVMFPLRCFFFNSLTGECTWHICFFIVFWLYIYIYIIITSVHISYVFHVKYIHYICIFYVKKYAISILVLFLKNIILGWWPVSTLNRWMPKTWKSPFLHNNGRRRAFGKWGYTQKIRNDKHEGFHFSWKRLHLIYLFLFLHLDIYIYIFNIHMPYHTRSSLPLFCLGGENIVVGVEKQRQGQYSILAGVAILWRSFEKGRC